MWDYRLSGRAQSIRLVLGALSVHLHRYDLGLWRLCAMVEVHVPYHSMIL